ncbi:hypothetical protein [Micromonospora sp. U21]|uniref:hypothetical protein n=1 Tax=Micromonospora sp. U21 TaxID=2824899 RepID=UPI001B35DBEF|nr:hypothetical protein [Micromonospora sp. U21]MBQ0906742.1 hypothetical protein [Micromonospora sp. U21]
MRYLSESFAVDTLRRSASIEQFLGPTFHGERRGIRWVAIEPQRNGRYAVMVYSASVGRLEVKAFGGLISSECLQWQVRFASPGRARLHPLHDILRSRDHRDERTIVRPKTPTVA